MKMKYIPSSYRPVSGEPVTHLHYKCHLSKEMKHDNLRCVVNCSATIMLNKEPRRANCVN